MGGTPKMGDTGHDWGKTQFKIPTKGACVARPKKSIDRLAEEKKLAEKYKLPIINASAKVDTNRESYKTVKAYGPGELETALIKHVIEGDKGWVSHCLAKNKGSNLLLSPWGGGITKTCILYAANKADIEMCKLLLRYGGNELLRVRDIKKRDIAYYFNKHGLDLDNIRSMGQGLVDCWNYQVLKKASGGRLWANHSHNINNIMTSSQELGGEQ